MSSELPTGMLTYLFTDLECSTQLWEQHPDAMKPALARHDTILHNAVEGHRGMVVKTTGDGLHAVFVSASDGICAALSAQEAIKAENWAGTEPLRVRMALHTGEAQLRAGDYYGSAVNRAARLMGIGHGGQILLSQATATLIQDALPLEADLLDLGDHRLNDLTSTEYVFQLSHPKLTNQFPPLRSLGTYDHNLPLQLNSFVGRERELEAINGHLSENRLLTLFGVGGTGKTRLMLQVAAQVLDDYKDGVWLVELASLTDHAQVLEQVASTFSLREQPGQPLLETLTDYLRYKQLLLIFDNCEHLVAASAQLVEYLLQACPNLTVLVTSREGLAIPGEVTFQVPSLSLPNQEQTTLDDIMVSECVQLFAERGSSCSSCFQNHTRKRWLCSSDLPTPGWHPSGDRIGSCTCAGALGGTDRQPFTRPLSITHRRQPHCAPTSANLTGTDRLELGSAFRTGTPPVKSFKRLFRRLDPGGS